MLSLHGRALARTLDAFPKLLSANVVGSKPIDARSCNSLLIFPSRIRISFGKIDAWAGSITGHRRAFLGSNANPLLSWLSECQKPQTTAEPIAVPSLWNLGKSKLASNAGCSLTLSFETRQDSQKGQPIRMYSTDSGGGVEDGYAGGTESSSKEESVHIAIGGNVSLQSISLVFHFL
jgi:hypothetical protein